MNDKTEDKTKSEDEKVLNIDLCKDSDGALSRWLWAAHEGQPHDARARVSLGSEDAEELRRWIESHPLAEGRTIEIHESEEPKTWVPWLDDGEIDDERRYLLQNEDGKQVEELELIIESLYEEGTSGHLLRYDEQVKAGYINVGRTITLSLDSYRPVDESADYLPSMEETILDWVLENPFEGLHCDDCFCCCGGDISDETRNAARVLALEVPHCGWENTSTVEVKVDTPLRRSMVLTQKSIQMRSRIRYVDTEAAE